MALWYTVVPPNEAHFVVFSGGKFVACPDETIGDKRAYYAFPAGIPVIGRRVRIIPLTVQEINVQQETYEKGQARYHITTSLKYRVTDVKKAAETIQNMDNLNSQIVEIIKSATRAVTAKYDVTEARSQKSVMQVEIEKEIINDFGAWGLTLVNFQLVDFLDTIDSKIISNISKRREVEIETTTREQNADKFMQARKKEATAEQDARVREIEKDEFIARREQDKLKGVAVQAQLTKEKEYEVVRTSTIKQAEINRDQASVNATQIKQVAIIEAEKQKEVMTIERQRAEIEKDKKELEGQGDRLKAEQVAIGEAAKQLQQLLAEAQGKTALQEALSKFDDNAIRAMVAPQIVDMQKTVGIATAAAIQNADVKLFSGSGAGQQGFDLAQILSSASVYNEKLADAIINKIARPNDLGLNNLKGLSENK